ncbi:hypothetical protein CEXT_166681 [Caerostris extrusa]|uniref:Uncharacterized protein n=1 Tax=Caerostris extrusa TaxID=172846 RepID=A0AAV4T1H9_CAEEX|nr:hypothetical protein CEXT_166681 [Caerostris extrusa]
MNVTCPYIKCNPLDIVVRRVLVVDRYERVQKKRMFWEERGVTQQTNMFFGERRQQQGVDDETVSKTRDACAEASFLVCKVCADGEGGPLKSSDPFIGS